MTFLTVDQASGILTSPGYMEWPRRPRQPQKLANKEEMASRRSRVILYFHIPCLIFHGRTSVGKHRCRV